MHGSLLLIKYMYGFIITSPRDKKLLNRNKAPLVIDSIFVQWSSNISPMPS